VISLIPDQWLAKLGMLQSLKPRYNSEIQLTIYNFECNQLNGDFLDPYGNW